MPILVIQNIQTNLKAFEIYEKIAQKTDHIFLDSSSDDLTYGRFSIMGVNPFLSLRVKQGQLYRKEGENPWQAVNEGGDLFDHLNQLLATYRVENPSHLPFVGGAIGYFSYDFGMALQNLTPPKNSDAEARFVFYDNAIVVDHEENKVYLTAMGIVQPAQTSLANLVKKLEKPSTLPSTKPTEDTIAKPFFQSPYTQAAYEQTVDAMRHYIKKGHVYIANLTHTFTAQNFTTDPLATYAKLRQNNPAPFSAYLPFEDCSILSSSPERFVQVRQDKVQTRPIKGTIKRGANPQEDAQNKALLEKSEKDKSELLMIVDLERNDLSKVCKPGSVQVTELFKTEAFATVFHLVSTIVGQLEPQYTAVDCLKATFPGGSITGAPKIRAMEVIDELERGNRDVYTGSIGYFSFDGNADFNIVIRSLVLKDNLASIGVGGGITWESEPTSEYEETLAKALALFNTLNAQHSS